ncbi:hypothetical protein L1987_04985 [Smallanthus sonchifolius]|uniref:Uncharacterized protein n=1 Tax=Smallanthus sonchifolius TaxID=185202 RepID=A0ACB9JU28_9ASTR|nr:hypothetical protein L1987_04985 [Smallanthus sonchifolius]
MPASRALCKSAGAGSVPDKFPAGLRVLVVDDDPICLMIIEKMLKQCNYEAIICNRAEIGLSMLRENKIRCDIVLSDVHMPDMDGFKLLEQIGLEMDLPIIMMSADEDSSVVMKGVTHGACDYIIKPVRIEVLKNIWQHVVRRQKHKWKDIESLTSADDVEEHQDVPEDVDHTSSANEGNNWKNTKRRIDDEDEYEKPDESSSSKKPRLAWSVELHQQFVAAVNQLGLDKAVPKKILELMNVPGLSRENIASHLQKYRLYLKRLSEPRRQGSVDTSFMDILDPGYELRALTTPRQLPGQSLAAVLGRSNYLRSPFPMPAIDQRNTFSFEDPRFRYGEVRTPHLLHGNSTNMEPTQFMSLHQPQHYSVNRVNSQVLMPMVGQGQDQGQCQSQSQHVFPNRMLAHGLGSTISRGGIVPSYNMLNDPNQIRPDSGSQNMTFSDLLTYTSPNEMGPSTSFAVDDEIGTHRDGTGDNEDDLLAAILNPPQEGFGQQENELDFDGYALDDLPRAT